jgi:hypothetical protein
MLEVEWKLQFKQTVALIAPVRQTDHYVLIWETERDPQREIQGRKKKLRHREERETGRVTAKQFQVAIITNDFAGVCKHAKELRHKLNALRCLERNYRICLQFLAILAQREFRQTINR